MSLTHPIGCAWVSYSRGFFEKSMFFSLGSRAVFGYRTDANEKSSSFDAYRIIVVQNSKWKRFKDWVLVSLSMKLFISVDFRWWLQYISMKAAFVASIKYHVSAMLRGSHPTMSLDEIHGQIR